MTTIRVYDDEGKTWEGDLEDFIEANPADADVLELLRDREQECLIGGGASPLFHVVTERAGWLK